ncbi:MAG: MBL fold metallo-hydrolase [Deltaproteobacteria bacterium]|nr:MBL fold metallo-hydrolase [Deltaproteobacteria bacterium]
MRYRIYSIEGNRQRLDGGAMFGNVPRPVWEGWIAPDARHRLPLACRGFLIHDEERDERILLETGIGLFFEPKLRDRFGVEGTRHELLASLAARGVEPEAIDLVVLSHLHFDHAGGLLSAWRPDAPFELVFPRARFAVGRRAWERAVAPHARDRASFIPELPGLLEASGRLVLLDADFGGLLGPEFSFTLSDGHTPGLLLTELSTPAGTAIFCGDLIPGLPWVHLPVTMGYDRHAELVIDEKAALLARAAERGAQLLFAHDPEAAACRVSRDAHGRYRGTDPLPVLDGFPL